MICLNVMRDGLVLLDEEGPGGGDPEAEGTRRGAPLDAGARLVQQAGQGAGGAALDLVVLLVAEGD